MTQGPKQNLINHVVFVVDRSGSMSGLRHKVVEVFDRQVRELADLSKELDQETRVTVYLFDSAGSIECVFYDKDVLRLPSLKDHYRIGANTALLDASHKAVTELKQTATLYGDHAFLVFVLTDGEENSSRTVTPDSHRAMLESLPDNWTVAALVPNQRGVQYAMRFGFFAGNVSQWDVSDRGLEQASNVVHTATANYMRARAAGVRGTRSVFTPDVQNLDRRTVTSALQPLPPGSYEFLMVPPDVRPKTWIKDFVEDRTGRPYEPGSAFYPLVKKEVFRPGRDVVVVEKSTGTVYGGPSARRLLGLPDKGTHGEMPLHPSSHPAYDVYLQSASLNRHVDRGTRLLLTH